MDSRLPTKSNNISMHIVGFLSLKTINFNLDAIM